MTPALFLAYALAFLPFTLCAFVAFSREWNRTPVPSGQTGGVVDHPRAAVSFDPFHSTGVDRG